MGMSSPEELKEKRPISMGLVAWAVILAFNLGVIYATILSAQKDIINDAKAAKEYTEQEVGGLRSDWERGNTIAKQDREQHLKRIEDLEAYHKE